MSSVDEQERDRENTNSKFQNQLIKSLTSKTLKQDKKNLPVPKELLKKLTSGVVIDQRQYEESKNKSIIQKLAYQHNEPISTLYAESMLK
jgi:hypothetical protein